jgi:pimeloyl-ACP methyl ester carboxylesterase
MTITQTVQHSVEVDGIIDGESGLRIAATIFLPERGALGERPLVFFCLPGGGLNSRYFYLDVPGHLDVPGRLDVPGAATGAFNFAHQMAARGCITVAIDHLGIGASSVPRDGFALTPDVMVAANGRAVEQMQRALRDGSLIDGLPALPKLRSIGVGHSMGGMLTTMQQAERHTHDAIAVLGFSTRGLPEYLIPEDAEFVDNPAGARANIVRLAQLRSMDPYPDLNTRGQAREIYGGRADKQALAALRMASDKVLAVMGFFSMLPGSTSDVCAQIDVPVFLAVGDRDMTGPAHALPASFSGSADVTLLVLPETGHTHFIFPSCGRLFQRLADWAHSATVDSAAAGSDLSARGATA